MWNTSKTIALAFIALLVCELAVAHTDGIYNPAANSVGNFEGIDSNAATVVVATTTWNPADKSFNITLSNGNLTFTAVAVGFTSLRAIASHSTGKFYFEGKATAASSSFCFPGIANISANINNFIGFDNNGISWTADGGIHLNNTTITTIQTFAVNDTLSIAVDMGNTAIWFRTNAGNWNNSGAANPATNTGGISFATMAAGPYFPAGTTNAASDSFTVNFGGIAYTQSVPSGFGNW